MSITRGGKNRLEGVRERKDGWRKRTFIQQKPMHLERLNEHTENDILGKAAEAKVEMRART